jgi:hypothetical protein
MPLLLILLSFFASPSFAAPSSMAEAPVAQSRFKFSRPSNVVRTFVQTCNSKGKVRAIRLEVAEGELLLNSLDVRYHAGGTERLAVKLKLARGQTSGWLVLKNQENPCLNQLEMNVGASRSMTTVNIIGRWEQ